MKVKIVKKLLEVEGLDIELAVEPDITNPNEFVRVRKELWDELVKELQLLIEATDKDRDYCNSRGFFELKDLLLRLNAISQASKGNLGKK